MSSDISNRTQGRNNMNVPNVLKPLLHLPILQFINEHTQEKSPINGPHSRTFSEVSSEMFLTGFGKTTQAKDIRQIHARLKMRSYAAEVFWAVLPRKRNRI